MSTPFIRLQDRVLQLGNHHRKYLNFVNAKQDTLIDRLEEKGLIEQVHLWSTAGKRFAKEMRIIQSVGDTKKQKIDFMGWFYSTQFLLMNIRAIDVLSLNIKLGESRVRVYRQFMKRIGWEFRHLTSIYMENLLRLFIDPAEQPTFAILGVGTRADQDDIDIGVIDDGSGKRYALNQAIGQIQKEMLRHASRLHFYLSESVQTSLFSISIDEYKTFFFGDENNDCILISEMLSAALIFGSKSLFNEFQKQVTDRYYYHKDQNNKYHEGYLRGILGEIRALLGRRIHPDSIHPKDDALRIIKSLAFAGKCISNIHRVNAWDILDTLAQERPERKAEYKILEDTLSFFEIFRFLYQLYVVQDEEIYLHEDPDFMRLDQVATAMGFQPLGVKKASDFLLVHYYENINKVRQVSEILIEDYSRHLRSINSFLPIFKSRAEKRTILPLNQFLRTASFFQGTKFWNDVFDMLDEDDGQHMVQLISGFHKLPQRKKSEFCRNLSDAAKVSFYSYFSLLVLIAKHKEKPGFQEFFNRMNKEFFRIINDEQDRTWRVARIFNYNPKLINNYVMALSEPEQKRFIHLLEVGNLYTRQDAIAKQKMKNLGELYFNTSRYFRRYSLSVLNKYPQFIEYVDDPEQLRKFAKGFLGSVENELNLERKKQILHDSFYIDFFRVGISLLQGHSVDYVESEFTAFFCDYIKELFNISRQEVNEELGEQIITRDLLGILVAGSLGREHAFEDDLDLIVLLNSNDEHVRRACTKVITRMNREIIRQGIMTHYRLADRFGEYVTFFSDLENFFREDIPDNFIEKSQLLSARMIVGSSRFEREFKKRILQPFIFDSWKSFIKAMMQEIQERHITLKTKPEFLISIKEGIGGIRDIELVLLSLKTFHHLDEPINKKIIDSLHASYPEYRNQMEKLGEAFDFLRHLRNVYRTVVAAKNTLDLIYLDRPAKIMGYKNRRTQTAAQGLFETYRKMCAQSTSVINEFLKEFAKKLELDA